MGKDLIDILEPVEGEMFFSWIFRLIVLESPGDLACNYSNTAKNLFSDDGRMPNLFWPYDIDEIIESCNLYKSSYLCNFSSFVEEMTNIPFYMDLCFGGNVRFDTVEEYKTFYKEYKYSFYNRYYNIQYGIHFCPECLKETDFPVFYKEHQIKGNKVCWKHGCELKYIRYEKKGRFINSLCDSSFLENAKGFDLDKNQLEEERIVAGEIHRIFAEGLKEDINIILKKIKQKMFYDNDAIWKRQYSYSDCVAWYLRKLCEGPFVSGYYRSKFRDLYETMFHVKEISNIKINDPVFLVRCICALFGSFEKLYAYELKDEDFPPLNTEYELHMTAFQ